MSKKMLKNLNKKNECKKKGLTSKPRSIILRLILSNRI